MTLVSERTGSFLRGSSLPLLFAFICLCVTLIQPMLNMTKPSYRYLFVLDITQSMNVVDMQLVDLEVSRLDYAKATLETALTSLPCGSEVGLGIFTAHRTFVIFSPVEICEHFRPLVEMLGKIDWRMAWLARSEVAKGLYSALDATRQLGDETHLVFLTDGHEAPPLNQSIRPPFRADPGAVAGLVAGVGGLVPSQIPRVNAEGNIVGFWSHEDVMQIDVYSLGREGTGDGDAMAGLNMANIARRIALGQEHLSSLRETHLLELATQTGLDYVRVDSPETFTETLKEPAYARYAQVLTNVGWIPALLAFCCLVYCFTVLPLRHRARPQAAG